MEVVMFYAELGGKLAAGVLAAFLVWLLIAVPVALVVGPLLARVSEDCPAVDEDDES